MKGILAVERAHTRFALWPMLLASTMLTGVSSAYAAETTVETVIVTAEKRTEDVQKVPMSIQVLGEQKLNELHVASFSDYAQYLPSVAFSANASGGGNTGPGFTNVYMRGVATGGDGNHSASLPSVGMYLDEQPITTIGGNLDIHVYDIARVEALAGPQGTLYGASSQSGTIRIITNKPDTSGFSASYDVEVNAIDKGGIGYSGEGYANVPLSDHAAIRLVAWAEHDAGYIDNVAGTNLAAGIVDGVRTFPLGGITKSNAAERKNNYNDADIYGGRAALKIDLDENWTVTPTIMAQETTANGSFAYDPAVGDLKVVKFAPEFSHDRWYQAGLTIEGKIANLDFTYAGAYMGRSEETQLDYSDYAFFYDAYYGQYFTNDAGNLIDPSQLIVGHDHFTKVSHELRVASPAEDRFRVVVGLFYERQSHFIEQRYKIADLTSAISIPGWPDTIWLTEQERIDRDYAAFGEASFDIFPNLTVTAGGRVFESTNSLQGFFGFSQGFQDLSGFGSGMNKCFLPTPIVGAGPCTDLNKTTDQKGFTHKVNLTWHVDDDRMLYFTWSNGFRPGGVNRNADVTSLPYKPDYLTNYELGWKTSWADGTVRFNGAVFWEDWKDFQFSFLGPNSLTVIANAGQATIKGVESDVNWRVDDHLTLTGSGTYIDAALTENYCGFSDANGNPVTDCPNPKAPTGQQLPITPKFKGNATARYEFDLGDFAAHLQASMVYVGSSWADLRTVERAIIGKQRAYTTADFSAGVERDNWSVELSLQNAFDERADQYRFSECTPTVCGAQPYIVTNRPRTIALKFGQKF